LTTCRLGCRVPIKGVLLFVFFVGSLPVCLARPFYGILLWTILAFLNPQSALFYWHAADSFPWAVAVAVPTVLGFAMFTSLISTHTPIFVHHAADTWLRWNFVSKVLFMTVITIAIVDTFERLRIFVLVIAGCFGYFILKALPFMIMTGGAFRLYGPEYSMISDNNDLGLALNMTLPLFFFLAQTEPRRWTRWLCGFLFVITIPAIFFTYSRGALVGLIVVLTMMLLRSKRRILLIPVLALGVVVAVLFAPAAWKERMDPTRPDAVDASARSRLNAWTYAWNLSKDYPVAGGGFSTFTDQLFDIYAPNTRDIHGPHSIYFQVLAEHGFVGLALYLALFVSCFAAIYRILKWSKLLGNDLTASYANMLGLSMVGFMISGIFLGRAYFDYFFAIVACLAVLERLCRRELAAAFNERDETDGAESEDLRERILLPESEAAF